MKLFKQTLCFLLCLMLTMPVGIASAEEPVTVDATSYLLMEASTGAVLLSKNETEARPMASITKLMTVLLILEELDTGNLSLTDEVTASANATAMGGSQIYLKENEVMDVNTLLKSILVASANDSCVAMAEHIAGSEAAFVDRMNERAKELEMTATVYKNSHGLDEEGHHSSAKDIAILSREVMKHDEVRNYTGIWQERIRNGTFELTNTNKLIRFYDGATGLKTGSTTNAGFCLSATAKRNGMELIAVVLNSSTGAMRFTDAKALLDYGFANYALQLLASTEESFGEATVRYGKQDTVKVYPKEELTLLSKKNETKAAQQRIELVKVKAPLPAGTVCGKLYFEVDGEVIKETDLITKEPIEKQSLFDTILEFLKVI